MKSLIAPILAVALVSMSCGGTAGGSPGGAGTAGARTAGAAGVAGTTGAAGAAGAAGGGTAGTTGTAGAAAGSSGGTAGTTGTAGAAAGSSGGAAGTTNPDGGADAARPCTTGDIRCDDSGHRLRCAADGSWSDDNYVCTVALSGSSDYNIMCALKADGSLACWAADDADNSQAASMVTHAPAGTWRQIMVGDSLYTICALTTSGTLSCWDPYGDVFAAHSGTFAEYSFDSYGSCAITDLGVPTCFDSLSLPSDFTGRFKQLVTAEGFVYGIDENDAVHFPEIVEPGYPAGKYKQIIANNASSCALRDDGTIFCSPVTNGALPPPTESGFIEVAATYGNRQGCALRGDGTVSCWLGLTGMDPLDPAPSGRFVHLAGSESAMCGIRTDGTTACWQIPGIDPLVPPSGW